MAYNPFDDVIDQDPAYMAEGGDPVYNRFGQRVFDDQSYLTDPEKVKEQLQEETRGIADVIARTAGPIAGLVTDPEGYQQTLDQEQRNRQILEQLGITNRQLTRDELERAKAAGYVPLTTGQALRKISGFLYSDLVKGSENIRAGVDYYDLPDNERMGVAMGLLDMADIALLPAVFKKLATIGIKKFGDKTNLKTMAQDPELQKQFPAETQEILSITGGGFTPAGVVREPDVGGRTISTATRDQKTKDEIQAGITNIKNLAAKGTIQKNTLTTNEIAEKLGIHPRKFKRQFIENQKENIGKFYTQEERDFVMDFYAGDYVQKAKITNEKKFNTMLSDLEKNPELRNKGRGFYTQKYDVPATAFDKETSKSPTLYAFTAKADETRGVGTPGVLEGGDKLQNKDIKAVLNTSIDNEDSAIINNLYRGTKNKTKYTPQQFLEEFKRQNPNFKNDRSYINLKKEYKKLEDERKKLQKQGINFFETIYKNPKYKKYLKPTDRKQFEFNKAHAFSISDVTQQDRFLNMAQMSDLIFNAPVGSNIRLQERLDMPSRVIANLTDEQTLEQLKNTPVTTPPAEISRRFRLNLPSVLQKLEEFGIKIMPESFTNLRDLIFGKGGIKEAIEKAYKDQGVGTLVPQGDKKTALVGVNPKNVTGQQRLNLLKKRFKKILDDQVLYDKTNGKKGKPIMRQGGDEREGGFIVGLEDGGEVKPVRMALGGDPLTNMNQQQFSPDPAFEGEDYFQEAVESGNLQAANLLNLFKVFKKPKVMATPSNIKQVEQANEALPQGVPGSQEIAPMQPGRPDFFFKSFLLDQLNSKNAPKASTPKGWREFLIKGRNVPEAEMLDTGILQYLEDTEKFYPNKKITREEIENLYDMSPLGNLEVRVKQTEPPIDRQGNMDFLTDQGRPKHKGVGRATIDSAADDYFEVVVNVPQLPGQEKAFINSAHFEEPNVLGFTRVGTYKNNAGETVAVIQEMQTDMLTEVRKEQERLLAMVNALRRHRAKLVNDINTMPPENTGYYKNELRVFDQKYPPERLEALESDNLIQPFPNIVAKDLIPEKTRSLNQIQEDINQLSMANVEQYTDPAYKTKIFDLAQEQQKILDDLMSMNRNSNYQEMLKDFKVPSTADRNELERIGYRDTYLPSDYQLKNVESFPPIPFNKQADYVDLLIKSTIKAAKQKGIDKVAIMPADVGANPRWGKDSPEAKKKFQNLYDKVGVQQLKNIAKKYGGKLEIEKIVDPNKGTRGLTFMNKSPDGEFQILKQTETRREISNADRDRYYDEEITRIVNDFQSDDLYNDEFVKSDIIFSREVAPGQMMDYYVVPGRGDATDVGYRMIPLKEGQNADDALIKIIEYNPSEVDMYTISFDPSKLEEPMYLFKKKSGGTIDKDSLVSITDIYGEYGR